MKNNVLPVLAIALAVILALSFYTANPAFAQLSFQTITPTGGALSSASDCNAIASNVGLVWLSCDGVLYAIDEEFMDDDHDVLASFTQTFTNPKALSSVQGNDVMILDAGTNHVYKFRFEIINDNPQVTAIGDYAPTCDMDTGFIYDELGFVWINCVTEDKVIRMNPTTMSTVFDSGDLTDGVGIDCDGPNWVSYSTSSDIGVIHCTTNNLYVTFEITSSTVGTLLDSEADGASEDFVFMDGIRDRFIVSRTGGIFTYDVNPTNGVMTLDQSNLGDASGYGGGCEAEPYLTTSPIFLVCVLDAGANQKYDGFTSNADGLELVMSQLSPIATVVTNGDSIGFDLQRQIYYGIGSTNDQRYVKISGLRAGDTTPDPPPSPTGNNTNNQVGGVCGNTDTNGDGRVNVIDCVGGNTAWDGITGGMPITDVVGSVGNGLGITDCEEGDSVDTCGSGLITFILFLILFEFLVLAGYLGLTTKLHADKEVIDVLLLMLIVGFATLALAFYLDWIPDLVFYSIVALIAGFLTFGVIAKIKGK